MATGLKPHRCRLCVFGSLPHIQIRKLIVCFRVSVFVCVGVCGLCVCVCMCSHVVCVCNCVFVYVCVKSYKNSV